MMQILRITILLLVAVAIEAFPTNQGPTKTGKIQHLSEYYANDHPDARPGAPSRPTPINPDIVSEPKPEEKVHIVKETEKDEAAAPGAHRSRRSVDDSEAQDQPTTPKPTRAWWRRMNFARTTEEPETVAEDAKELPEEEKKEEGSGEEKKEVAEDESAPKESTEKDCESEEHSDVKESINIQRIQTQSLPVIQPHVDLN